MRYPRKRDNNERSIIDALKAYGVSVQQLDGAGVPDLLCGIGGRNTLLEVKQAHGKAKVGGKKTEDGLLDSQRKWFAAWRGAPPIVVTTPAEAIDALGALALPCRVG